MFLDRNISLEFKLSMIKNINEDPDEEFMEKMAGVISDESGSKYFQEFIKQLVSRSYKFLRIIMETNHNHIWTLNKIIKTFIDDDEHIY